MSAEAKKKKNQKKGILTITTPEQEMHSITNSIKYLAKQITDYIFIRR